MAEIEVTTINHVRFDDEFCGQASKTLEEESKECDFFAWSEEVGAYVCSRYRDGPGGSLLAFETDDEAERYLRVEPCVKEFDSAGACPKCGGGAEVRRKKKR